MAMMSIQIIIALTEGVVSIISAVICCRAACCRTSSGKAGQVFFQGQQTSNAELGVIPAMQQVLLPVALGSAMQAGGGQRHGKVSLWNH
jgi:hypothetical protein